MTSTLREQQQLFWRAVRFDPAPPEVDDAFLARGALSGRDRMAIYRRMYWYRQVDALWECFPVLGELLGEERFTKLACAYIAAHPSEHPALERLGRRLPSFVRMSGGAMLGADAALAADVAELEEAELAALVAPDPPSVARLSDLPLARLAEARLELVPSLQLRDVLVVAAHRVLRSEDVLAADAASTCTVLHHRPHHAPRARVVLPEEAAALRIAQAGAPLAAVCAAFAADPAPTTRAAITFSHWFGDALVARVRFDGDLR